MKKESKGTPPKKEPDQSTKQPQRRIGGTFAFWRNLVIVYLGYSLIMSWLAPVGYWESYVLGARYGYETDPGGTYFASAYSLFDEKLPYFVGHPGLTMQFLIFIVLKAVCGIFSFNAPDQTAFAVRHITLLFVITKLLITICHLVSFYVVYRFALRIVRSDNAAVFAVLAYATTFPVLYYISRISVEPIMIILFLLPFLLIWEYRDLVRHNKIRKGLLIVATAAIAAVSNLFTKFSIFSPLPFFLLFYLLADGLYKSENFKKRLRENAVASVVYAAAGIVTAVMYNFKMDWNRFFDFWSTFAPGGEGGEAQEQFLGSFFENVINMLLTFFREFFSSIWTTFVTHFWGHSSQANYTITFQSEWLFFVVAIVGAVVYFRRHGLRSYAVWPLIYVGLTFIIWIYRAVLSYMFPMLPLAAVFFGYALDRLLRKVDYFKASISRAKLIVVCIVCIHFVGIWAAVESRIYDCAQYTVSAKKVHRAMWDCPYGKMVGVFNQSFDTSHEVYFNSSRMFFYHYLPIDKGIHYEVNKLFLYYKGIEDQGKSVILTYLDQKDIALILFEKDGKVLGPFTLKEFSESPHEFDTIFAETDSTAVLQ